MVKAVIYHYGELGVVTIRVQRAKYKHWFDLGAHRATDIAFSEALKTSSIEWELFPPISIFYEKETRNNRK